LTVLLDARKNEWYTAGYCWNSQTQCPVNTDPPRAIRPQDLLDLLAEREESVYLVGDAVPKYAELLQERLGKKAVIPPDFQGLPRGAYAVREVWRQWQVGGGASTIEPFYIRRSEAEVKWLQKQQEGRKDDWA
jgi:tRNA threonylcarbamoyladenosine biosynthesis protein TsaB